MNWCFTYESRVTLKSFLLFIRGKAITNLSLLHIDKSEIKNQKIGCRGSRSPNNTKLGHHVLVLQRTAKEFTMNYNARAQPLFCSLNLLFSDVAGAVAVVSSHMGSFYSLLLSR